METISETATMPSGVGETPQNSNMSQEKEVNEDMANTSLLIGGSHNIQSSHQALANLPSKFKRTSSVSFNVESSRSSRHSVDIRNMPSLAHKRASIVDVAKGAMSSLMQSFASSAGGDISPVPDEEPIFEEPIAPTLSLGQRVALVKNSGAEFGTVGWIGQLFDVDDDWMVGVIFDNMIGDCDGAYKGVRYFYARENYAMFVPLSSLTKTDNYIGRPETGTMLSRMSVSLKPGQLISIQRSSIRLQHCFLNAPHQRVGHDVRAVSNRLHCQCHNCGPCAHLTKQASRMSALGPAFGAHHAPNKKNSLAHAAVEILAHHHHHYHEEEHEEDDYQFGDNAAHACNFVRYSCCQQSGSGGHEFSADCEMVRPELLDNLIHAPKAPHRRSRPKRRNNRHYRQCQQQMLTATTHDHTLNQINQVSTLDSALTIKSSWASNSDVSTGAGGLGGEVGNNRNMNNEPSNYNGSASSYSSSSSDSSSSRSSSPDHQARSQQHYQHYDEHQQIFYESPSFHPGSSAFNTIDTQMSIMDQQRFIYQRDSSAFTRSQQASNVGSEEYYDDDEQTYTGFGSSFRKCFNCLMGRRSALRRGKKRRTSSRNKVLEYRRKQFTFVPSTLAKPHEDFASHGIIIGGAGGSAEQDVDLQAQQQQEDYNSDYSSFSKSPHSSVMATPQPFDQAQQQVEEPQLCLQNETNSNVNPPTGENYNLEILQNNTSPYGDIDAAATAAADGATNLNNTYTTNNTYEANTENPYVNGNLVDFEGAHETTGVDVEQFNSINPQLKSTCNNTQLQQQQRQLDYDDYTYSNSENNSYKKNCYSCESALTDMGYFDTYNSNSSNDTLKNIVESTINEEVSLPEVVLYNDCDQPLSPIVSVSGSNQSDELVDVSSPTNSSPALDHQHAVDEEPTRNEDSRSAEERQETDDVTESMGNITIQEAEEEISKKN